MAGRKPMKQQSRRVSGKGNASGDSAAAMMLRVAGGDATPPRRRTTAVPNRPPSTHTAPPPSTDPAVLVASVVSCSVIEGLTPQSIGVSYWFDSSGVDESGEVPVRLVGRRVEPSCDAEDPPGSADAFDVVHVVRDVPSGVGQLCATIRVTGTAPGEWEVDAYPPHASPVRVRARTGFQPFIGEIAPGASLGAWALLVFLGALAGVSLFMFLVSRAQLPVAPIGLLAVLACVIGVVGAKVYYLAQAPGRGSWTSPGRYVHSRLRDRRLGRDGRWIVDSRSATVGTHGSGDTSALARNGHRPPRLLARWMLHGTPDVGALGRVVLGPASRGATNPRPDDGSRRRRGFGLGHLATAGGRSAARGSSACGWDGGLRVGPPAALPFPLGAAAYVSRYVPRFTRQRGGPCSSRNCPRGRSPVRLPPVPAETTSHCPPHWTSHPGRSCEREGRTLGTGRGPDRTGRGLGDDPEGGGQDRHL